MTAPANGQIIGRWRIVEADIWDRAHLDLDGPATITIGADGRGEIEFGAMQAGLDLEYSRTTVFFTWEGFDEMDDVRGSGAAELLEDGSIEIEFAYHLGDEAVLKAVRDTSSTACLSNFAGTAIRPESPSRIYASRAAHMRPTKEVLIMRKALLITALVFAFAAPAGASQCPQDMAAIDSALQSAQLSEVDKAKVMELREQGEEQHKAGKHAASVKTLGEAKQILGIQ